MSDWRRSRLWFIRKLDQFRPTVEAARDVVLQDARQDFHWNETHIDRWNWHTQSKVPAEVPFNQRKALHESKTLLCCDAWIGLLAIS